MKAGANVILRTKGIDDTALKVRVTTSLMMGFLWLNFKVRLFKVELWVECWVQYFVVANAIAVRHVSKEDMRHIAKATGATQVRRSSTFNSLGLIFSFLH